LLRNRFGVFIPLTLAQQIDKPDLIQNFPAGDNPTFLAFDGANIWVSNSSVDTVTKLRASDGALVGTFAVGNQPQWMTFDGANVWVSNLLDGTVTKLRARDGVTLGTFPVDSGPEGIAWSDQDQPLVRQEVIGWGEQCGGGRAASKVASFYLLG